MLPTTKLVNLAFNYCTHPHPPFQVDGSSYTTRGNAKMSYKVGLVRPSRGINDHPGIAKETAVMEWLLACFLGSQQVIPTREKLQVEVFESL